MNKHQITSTFNLIFGVFLTLIPIHMILFVLPRINQMYADYQAQTSSHNTTYLVLTIVFILGLSNLYFARKNFSKTKPKSLKLSLFIIFLSWGLGMAFIGISAQSTIGPIYNLAG